MRAAIARVPLAARVCLAIAFVNAVCWSFITPPFQVPDEPSHFAYVQQLAEAHALPKPNTPEFSAQEKIALQVTHAEQIRTRPTTKATFTEGEQSELESQLNESASKSGPGGAGVASSQPPLYYALQTIPYALASGGTLLDQLTLMRLLSAVFAGLTALFAFMFLRETLPAQPWAWTVGGLGVAVAPMLGFISGGVNPDSMLFAVSAALFYCLARGFRRGLSRRLAIATGAVIAIGLLTKLNFIGLAPGAALGLALLARRQAATDGSVVYRRSLLPALAIAAAPIMLYMLANLAAGKPVLGSAGAAAESFLNGHSSLPATLSFIWQFYLPRLPGMHDYFGELFTTRQLWFNGLVGLYGWVDTPFPGWVYDLALIPAALIAGLLVRELARTRAALGARLAELAVYAVMTLGVLLLVGASGYRGRIQPAEFAEPRYLLPMLALWGAALALAARGAGRRWGPSVGALLIVLFLAQDIFSQLQVIGRYYI